MKEKEKKQKEKASKEEVINPLEEEIKKLFLLLLDIYMKLEN